LFFFPFIRFLLFPSSSSSLCFRLLRIAIQKNSKKEKPNSGREETKGEKQKTERQEREVRERECKVRRCGKRGRRKNGGRKRRRRRRRIEKDSSLTFRNVWFCL
jgi:hypothetical protein